MSEPELPVLILAPGRDGELAARVLAARGQTPICFDTWERMLAHLDERAGAVLVAEETLADRFAEQLVLALGRQPAWSDLPILLVAHPAHQRPRMPGVALLGNVAVLTRPMAIDALVSATASALRARRRQFQVRDLLRSQAEDARRKDDFLAMLAHELRNPLAPVRFAAQVLETSDLPRDQLKATVALIGRQVTHMARIIDDLLDVSRLSRGQVVLEKELLDVAELARRIALDHGPIAAARQVRVRTRIAAQPLRVEGDRTRLKQVLDNLIDNAIKFSSAGAEVTIEASTRAGHAVLAVIDEGEGLDPDLVPHLFEPFAQADRSLERRRGGLGLGLALVRALTHLHGGEVTAESPGPGRGSVFTVSLPLADPADLRDANDVGHAHEAGSFRVLIAEDNHDAAESLRMLLEIGGHEVAVVSTGLAAVEEAKRFRPHILLCDIGLPGIDGYEVARRLRSDPEMHGTRLIAVTGYATDDDRLQAAAAGFDRHLRKPVEPAVLMAEFEALRDEEERTPRRRHRDAGGQAARV